LGAGIKGDKNIYYRKGHGDNLLRRQYPYLLSCGGLVVVERPKTWFAKSLSNGVAAEPEDKRKGETGRRGRKLRGVCHTGEGK